MKHLLTILVCLISGNLFACGDAYEQRLFPIGTSNGKIVVVETSLFRSDMPDTGKVIIDRLKWRGITTLKSLDAKGNYLTIQVVDTFNFLDKSFNKEVKDHFQKAVQIAERLPNFIKASTQKIEYCNLKTDCQLASLKNDTTHKKLFIVTSDKKEIAVKYPEPAIDFGEQLGGITNQLFKISSIRKIQLDKMNLLVVHCATGEEHNSDLNFENQLQCSSPTDCFYPEIVLYHGLSFDVITWNKL